MLQTLVMLMVKIPVRKALPIPGTHPLVTMTICPRVNRMLPLIWRVVLFRNEIRQAEKGLNSIQSHAIVSKRFPTLSVELSAGFQVCGTSVPMPCVGAGFTFGASNQLFFVTLVSEGMD
jgi:hypothetical protein